MPYLCVVGGGCGELSNPDNGRVEVSSNKVGGVATYSCNDGYRLVGDDTRVCKDSGSWDGTMPSCEGWQERERERDERESLTEIMLGRSMNVMSPHGIETMGLINSMAVVAIPSLYCSIIWFCFVSTSSLIG